MKESEIRFQSVWHQILTSSSRAKVKKGVCLSSCGSNLFGIDLWLPTTWPWVTTDRLRVMSSSWSISFIPETPTGSFSLWRWSLDETAHGEKNSIPASEAEKNQDWWCVRSNRPVVRVMFTPLFDEWAWVITSFGFEMHIMCVSLWLLHLGLGAAAYF